MFDEFFTTYSSLDPPPIKREKVKDTYEVKDNYLYDFLENPYQESTEIEPEDTQNYDLLKPLQVSNNFQIKNTKKQDETPQNTVLKGPKDFELAFQKALEIDPSISKYKNFLVKTAKRESGFNSYIQNSTGAPYYGYFQMGKNEIAMTTKLSIDQFRNNPVAQILGACKLYEMNLKSIKRLGIYNLGKQRGYSDDALVAGAWLGGPGGVKKYLLGLGDPSDSHWYKNGKGGTSVGKVMNQYERNRQVS